MSPFEHVARFALDPFTVQPLFVMGATAAVGAACSLLVIRERDIDV